MKKYGFGWLYRDFFLHEACVTYIQQIYFFQQSFSYFIYLSYFVLKKTEIRVKPGHLQQIKKNYGPVTQALVSGKKNQPRYYI